MMNRLKKSVKYAVLLIFMIACSFSGLTSTAAAERQQPQPVSVEQLIKKQSLRVSETAGKKPNVTGSIQKGKKKIEKGAVQIVGGSESDEQFYEADIKKGIFSLYLPDGAYTVEGYWDQTGMFVSCNYSFTVVKGKSNPSPLKIVIPADNVKGDIERAGKKVASGFLFISNEGGKEVSYFAEIKNGKFNLYLPDGSYVVDGYIDDKGIPVSVRYSFTVVKGKSNPSPLKITIPADNVKGSIQKAGKKVSSGFLFISDESSKEEYSHFAEIKNGQFSLYLPDGSYTVEGYTNDEGILVPLKYSFTVAKGKSNPSPLKIAIPADNVKGSVQKAGEKMAYGTIVIGDMNSKEDVYFAEIKNGQFSLYLPDGKYEVAQYIDPISEEETPLKYAFTVKKGKSNPSVLKVELPKTK